jgi:hypothetical protein
MSLKGTFISPLDIIKFMLLLFYISFRAYNVYSRLHLPYVTELHQEYLTLVDFSYSMYVLSFTCSQWPRHDITEALLKVELNIKTLTPFWNNNVQHMLFIAIIIYLAAKTHLGIIWQNRKLFLPIETIRYDWCLNKTCFCNLYMLWNVRASRKKGATARVLTVMINIFMTLYEIVFRIN